MKNKYATIDASLFPTVIVNFTGEYANESNFSLYLKEVKHVYEGKERLAFIFDASKAVIPGLKFQKMQADWLKENKLLIKGFCVGTAYVIPNIVIRNVLKAIFKFQEQPVPFIVSGTLKEAKEWAESKLL